MLVSTPDLVTLDGLPIGTAEPTLTISEAGETGRRVGTFFSEIEGVSVELLEDAGGRFFLSGADLRVASGVLDADEGSYTLSLAVTDAAGAVTVQSLTIGIADDPSHVIAQTTAGDDTVAGYDGGFYAYASGGNDVFDATTGDLTLVLSGNREDYDFDFIEGNAGGYGGYGDGEATPDQLYITDLREGAPDGADLVLTDVNRTVSQFIFADGRFSSYYAQNGGSQGLTLDGRALDIAGYLPEELPVGTVLGQIGLHGTSELPQITSVQLRAFYGPDYDDYVIRTGLVSVAADGTITLTGRVSYEDYQRLELQVGYVDELGYIRNDTLKVLVDDYEDAPEIVDAPGFYEPMRVAAYRDMTEEFALGSVYVTDEDGAVGALTYTLGGADAALFELRDGVLYLRAGAEIGGARSFDLTLSVHDEIFSADEVAAVALDIYADLASPIDAITWNYTAPSVINVYFAPGGLLADESGALLFDGELPYTTMDWGTVREAAAKSAFASFSAVANLTFNYVSSLAEADFAMLAASTMVDGASAYAVISGGDLSLGGQSATLDGWARYGFTLSGMTGDLAQGSFGYWVLIHEIGHALGLAHPHDEGGGSTVLEGVEGAYNSYGTGYLNQGVYTIMSYNRGWELGPNGETVSLNYGASITPAALDIAVLQAKYGANMSAGAGNSTYRISTIGAEGYSAIWDTSGYDRIVHSGAQGAYISLVAATLDYTVTGGGVVSYVQGAHGGLTIASGVQIEAARGGSGNDTLLGNGLANVLEGGAGDGTLN